LDLESMFTWFCQCLYCGAIFKVEKLGQVAGDGHLAFNIDILGHIGLVFNVKWSFKMIVFKILHIANALFVAAFALEPFRPEIRSRSPGTQYGIFWDIYIMFWMLNEIRKQECSNY
jgi:hypothetical protein